MNSTLVNCLCGFGLLLAILSALFAGCFSTIFEILLAKMLVIAPNSSIYQKWQESPVPIYMQYYFFNVTNPEEVQYDGDKPILNEIGPYTYMQISHNENVEFDEDGNEVSYDANTTLFFDREKSVGDETDLVMTLNPILVVLGDKMQSASSVFQTLGGWAFWSFDTDSLFIQKPIGELLYHGYKDDLVEFMGQITGNPKLEAGYFGYFYMKNGTSAGKFKVKTGKGGMDDYQMITEFNDRENLTYWKTDYCNMVNGTAGKQFPPGITKTQSVRLFSSSLCRSMHTIFEKETTVNGLPTYRFILHDEFYVSEPVNTCFCSNNFTCRDSMVNLSPCRGAPIVLSTPHFYGGNIIDQQNVIGLTPDKEKHETFLDIEPVTGIIAQAAKRLQINLPMKRYNFPAFDYCPEIMMPIFWAEEGATVPLSSANRLKSITQKLFRIVYGVCAGLVVLGLILMSIAMCKKDRRPKDKRGSYHLQPQKATNGFHMK